MTLYSGYSGRLADIMDDVYALAHDTDGGTAGAPRFVTPAENLLWIGRCLEDLANAFYFKTSALIDIVANQREYDLLALIPRLVKATAIRKTDESDWIVNISDDAMHNAARQYASSWATGKMGYIRGTKFYMEDPPTTGTTDGLELAHSFCPPYQITLSTVAVVNAGGGVVTLSATGNELVVGDRVMIYGSTNYSGRKTITAVTADTFSFAATYVAETIGSSVTCHCEPRTPLTNDIMFVYFCLMRRAMKDRDGAKSAKDLQNYSALYEREKAKLISTGLSPMLKLRPGRRM